MAAAVKAAAAADAEVRAAKAAGGKGGGGGAPGAAAGGGGGGGGKASAPASNVPALFGGSVDALAVCDAAAVALAALASDPGLCAMAVGHCARTRSAALVEALALAVSAETGVFTLVSA